MYLQLGNRTDRWPVQADVSNHSVYPNATDGRSEVGIEALSCETIHIFNLGFHNLSISSLVTDADQISFTSPSTILILWTVSLLADSRGPGATIPQVARLNNSFSTLTGKCIALPCPIAPGILIRGQSHFAITILTPARTEGQLQFGNGSRPVLGLATRPKCNQRFTPITQVAMVPFGLRQHIASE